jgi:acyl-coenzyme A synthetase/AMP-(fatty) acid ligase
MLTHGELPDAGAGSLRVVLFAGEEFPLPQLRELKRCLPASAVLYNLYGPTETNVCTYYRVPDEIPSDWTRPVPIGRACSHVRVKVDGAGFPPGDGELLVSGDGVMKGYWGGGEDASSGFLRDGDGVRWYRTGDIVRESEPGCFQFLGRRDRMFKKRGFRVEPAEIEGCLRGSPEVEDAVVVPHAGKNGEISVVAFVRPRDGFMPTLISLKEACARSLPPYLTPDMVKIVKEIPRTSTAKVDFAKLKEMLE